MICAWLEGGERCEKGICCFSLEGGRSGDLGIGFEGPGASGEYRFGEIRTKDSRL